MGEGKPAQFASIGVADSLGGEGGAGEKAAAGQALQIKDQVVFGAFELGDKLCQRTK